MMTAEGGASDGIPRGTRVCEGKGHKQARRAVGSSFTLVSCGGECAFVLEQARRSKARGGAKKRGNDRDCTTASKRPFNYPVHAFLFQYARTLQGNILCCACVRRNANAGGRILF